MKKAVSEIVIDEYSHITVLHREHKVPEEGRSIDRVHPMGRADIPKKGIFSTCSPARPNPVIDIKPYVPDQYPEDDVRILA